MNCEHQMCRACNATPRSAASSKPARSTALHRVQGTARSGTICNTGGCSQDSGCDMRERAACAQSLHVSNINADTNTRVMCQGTLFHVLCSCVGRYGCAIFALTWPKRFAAFLTFVRRDGFRSSRDSAWETAALGGRQGCCDGSCDHGHGESQRSELLRAPRRRGSAVRRLEAGQGWWWQPFSPSSAGRDCQQHGQRVVLWYGSRRLGRAPARDL